MPQPKPKSRPAAKKQTGARKPAARKSAAQKAPAPRAKRDARAATKRTTELSEDVLKELEDGAQSAIDAVRKFLVTVDDALPPASKGPSRGEEITDSALEMAQRLVHTQSEFLRKVVDSAGKSLRSGDAK